MQHSYRVEIIGRESPLISLVISVYTLRMAGAERSIAFYFYYFDPIGENLFALFASLTYAYYYLMTLIK